MSITTETIYQTLITGTAASIAWFIIGGVCYMNPFIDKIYKKHKDHPSMKKWKSQSKYMINMFIVGGLIPALFLAFIYAQYFSTFLTNETVLKNIVTFTIIVSLIRIVPRFFDMWIQTSYPNKLLKIELVNGIIGTFVIAATIILTSNMLVAG